jgi:hypothetical protein
MALKEALLTPTIDDFHRKLFSYKNGFVEVFMMNDLAGGTIAELNDNQDQKSITSARELVNDNPDRGTEEMQTCSNCAEMYNKLFYCPCHVVGYYCGKTCQLDNYPYHKRRCLRSKAKKQSKKG